ncbi:type II secretion system protein N [Ningiella sp. W23]|uniref:type II secretion system protein N n=1 Tax=Ningiella sp. W23 TaxID=3023715 RepID=UPI003757B0EA
MKLPTWLWIILALIAYALFVFANTPAVYVSNFVNTKSQGEVSILGASGTLFNGNAMAIEASGFRVNNVEWSLSPLALLIARADIELTGGAIRNAEQIYVNADARLSLFSPENFSLQNTQILVPAKTVLSQVPLPVAVTANGRFRVDIETLSMEPGCTELSGEGAWLNAVVDTPAEPVNLGSFEANLACREGSLIVDVAPGNRLNLSASILIDPQGRYEASGQFKPDANLPEVIQQAVQFFPFEQNEQGFYLIDL